MRDFLKLGLLAVLFWPAATFMLPGCLKKHASDSGALGVNLFLAIFSTSLILAVGIAMTILWYILYWHAVR